MNFMDRTASFRPTHLLAVLGLVVGLAALAGARPCRGEEAKVSAKEELKPMLKIRWRLGPDYPMGIQDAAMGVVHGKIVAAGGFTRHPADVVKHYPDAFGGQPSGFTKLTFVFDPRNESAGWKRIADIPGPPRQGAAVAVVDDMLYAMGGINYTDPLTYRDTYRLQEKDGKWTWEELPNCRLPWPAYGATAGTAVIGKRIYLTGVAEYFQGPGADGPDFHSEAGRDNSPVGKALLVLDTSNLKDGWKRLADCPGVPKFDATLAAAGGKIYELGGVFAPLAKSDAPYYNAVDSFAYDPTKDNWTKLPDMPQGCNRRALPYADRYIVLVSGFKYAKTRKPDGSVTAVYTDEEKTRAFNTFFQDTVLVYDTRTGRLGTADHLAEVTCFPSAAVLGDTLYVLGGEGGPRLYHPATLQIGTIVDVLPH